MNIGWVMVTVWGDTNCDGTPDGYLSVDTWKEGWAMYDADGNHLGPARLGEVQRTCTALEFQLDRARDEKWAFNATYVLSWNRGNAEGPVNSDTDFDDTGRTGNFDTPWVNASNGYLPNARRHQLKLRGTHAPTLHWQLAATLNAQTGGPVTGHGVGNPFDATNYHSCCVCVQNCDSPTSEDCVYEASPRGGFDHLG